MCFTYNLESKCQSATWFGPQSPKAKELRFKKSHIKTMLVAFFESRGLIHKEFVPTGQSVNANFYKDVFDHLIKRINHVRPDLRTSADLVFCKHDNTPVHNAALVRQFLAKKEVTVLHRPPYLPNLALAHYFLFSKINYN